MWDDAQEDAKRASDAHLLAFIQHVDMKSWPELWFHHHAFGNEMLERGIVPDWGSWSRVAHDVPL